METTETPHLALQSANRLIREKSPYLLQHARNPVDWYPWGQAAVDKARAEDRPIILSIGYSTCHWCHVMEKESFMEDTTADAMNRYFVNIKVDREERPDIDILYMTAVTTMTGSGGWPLNVFLTPELKPFYGGTYFPAAADRQMMSWPELILHIARMWKDPEKRKKIDNAADALSDQLEHYLSPETNVGSYKADLSPVPMVSAFEHYAASYDASAGGFGKAPKFPSPVIQNFLFAFGGNQDTPQKKKAVTMAHHTLAAMARGGIYDHIGGGFHRYATDGNWHVPHFEKMLYDNAQLILNYLDGFLVTKNADFAGVAARTADYVIREMTDATGGFYAAEDADSFPEKGADHKIEGAYYVWEKAEIESILSDEPAHARVFNEYYGLKQKGNVALDPHGYFINKNVLHITEKATARSYPTESKKREAILAACREKLFQARKLRPRPHVDDKVITAWNGLMISAMAKAYAILRNDHYLQAARNGAQFIKRHLFDGNSSRLYRRWREGEKKVGALAEDYAFLVQGLLDLDVADPGGKWREWSEVLLKCQIRDFYDTENGGFFMTAIRHDPNLIVRIKTENDGVVPGANAVSVVNLIRMSAATGNPEYRDLAENTIRYFYPKIQQFPGAMPQMLVALDRFCRSGGAGDGEGVFKGFQEPAEAQNTLKI